MSDEIFPSLAGLKIGIKRTVSVPPVSVRTTASRREYRARDSALIKYRFTLSYEVLRAGAEAELQLIEDFFKARGGSFDNFLFRAPDDNTVAGQSFGTGNGATTQFQLVRRMSSYAEPVRDLNGAPQVFKAGVLQATPAAYSVSATGLVTFTAAPGAGQALTWSGAYYWRCRFLRDEMDLERMLHLLYELRTVELITDPQ